MADIKNSVSNIMKSLSANAEGVLSAKTVVGKPIQVGETIIIPLSDVTVGFGAGANNTEHKDNGMGGFSAKMTPSAVLVIKGNNTRVVNIKDLSTASKILDMVPEMLDKILNRDKNPMPDEEVVNTAFPDEAAETAQAGTPEGSEGEGEKGGE